MKLQSGHYYVDASGEWFRPIRHSGLAEGIFTDGIRLWNEDGTPLYPDSEYAVTLVDEYNGIDKKPVGWGKTPVQPASPVQLRKVIVPGVYGRLHIQLDPHDSDYIRVGLANRLGEVSEKFPTHGFTRAELIAARDVFNALIDAMEE